MKILLKLEQINNNLKDHQLELKKHQIKKGNEIIVIFGTEKIRMVL